MNVRFRKTRRTRPAYSLIELLVVIATIAVLSSFLLPTLAQARSQAKGVVCSAHLAELGHAFHMYAAEYRGRAMPLVYWDEAIIGSRPWVYWWGTNDVGGVDHTQGFVWPYLPADFRANGLFECPCQPWGSYNPQGGAHEITSTYGYNGYYLSPPHTGYRDIKAQPWKDVDQLYWPEQLFTFADTLLDLDDALPQNTAHLDPPELWREGWKPNFSPTTAFRHSGRANALLADGHVEAFGLEGGTMQNPRFGIGSVGATNDPHYVPDWREW
jgi:prepilin-type processing-associated H-X9-DG protein